MSTSFQPLPGLTGGYLGIAGALRLEIVRGTLPAGSQLPPISDLARRHGTTAITVRRALRMLEEEGLVRVEHGVGTFVADWARGYDGLHLPGFASEMAARSLPVRTERLGHETGVRHATAAAALGLAEEAPLAVLTRRRWIGETPIVFQRSYAPEALGELLAGCGADRSLYELIRERAGRVPVSAEERLRAVRLPAEAARALEVEPDAVGWLSERTTRDLHGEPLIYDEAAFPAERVALRVQRRAGQTGLEFELVRPPDAPEQGKEPQ